MLVCACEKVAPRDCVNDRFPPLRFPFYFFFSCSSAAGPTCSSSHIPHHQPRVPHKAAVANLSGGRSAKKSHNNSNNNRSRKARKRPLSALEGARFSPPSGAITQQGRGSHFCSAQPRGGGGHLTFIWGTVSQVLLHVQENIVSRRFSKRLTGGDTIDVYIIKRRKFPWPRG